MSEDRAFEEQIKRSIEDQLESPSLAFTKNVLRQISSSPNVIRPKRLIPGFLVYVIFLVALAVTSYFLLDPLPENNWLDGYVNQLNAIPPSLCYAALVFFTMILTQALLISRRKYN